MANEQIYQRTNEKTHRDYPRVSLPALIHRQCVVTPDAIAVVCGQTQQTYRELDDKSDQIAKYLCSNGVGRGDLIGLCCDRNLDTPVLLVGIMKSGAGYVPLDPDYPVDRLAYMIENSEVKHIIAHANQIPIVQQFDVPTTIVDRDSAKIESVQNALVQLPELQAETDVAYVIYTSGSTGKPKGVLVPHQAVVNMLSSMVQTPGFTANDRILATTTLSFDISVCEMFLPLIAGGSLAIVDRATAKDRVALVNAIEQHEITVMQATPAMWRMILESDFSGGKHLSFFSGGEPLPRDLINPLLERCGQLWNLYGPTETTVWSSAKQITNDQDRILIGQPIANTSMYIVDEQNNLCQPETPGELLIGGDGVTLGYLKRDKLTAEKFIKFNGEKVYRTGDLAQITETGEFEHLGRMDGQIKIDGHRVELGEIDAALAMQPGVRRAATVLREDRPGDKRLVGYLLAIEKQQPDIAQIREAISKTLPTYMVPNVIVTVDQFHYTPSGKLDRKAFAPPSTARPDLATDFVPAQSELEKQLAKIWCETLQVDSVGIHDNFFELGGTSLRAATTVAQVKKVMSIVVTTAEFFDNPTIAAFLSLAQRKQTLIEKFRNSKHENTTGSGQFAIVGMSARMPGAANVKQFWNNLVEGRESIKFFDSAELDSTLDPRETTSSDYVPARGIIDNATEFDARFFNTTPRIAELTDPQQRVLLELAWTALEDAGIIPDKTDQKIGVWAGAYTNTYFFKNVLSQADIVGIGGEFQAGIYNEKDYIATRIAHALNLTGPAINVNTACSTSLVALIEACKSLAAGHCSAALAGGVSITFPQNSGHLFQEGSIFTPDGHCRPFDANAAGTLFCDGAGLVVVKCLEDAIENRDRIYAVIKGYGINNDGGEKASFSAPSIQGQADAIAMAHANADVDPTTIGYIEAHGTATPVGDPIEISALQTVFQAQTDAKQFCAIGSVKSNIGHTVAAAGVAGLIKASLSLYHEQIPATLNFENPNPQIDFDSSPFFVCQQLTPWKRSEQPRRAGVSSFGVGGTNAHILIEEAPLNTSRQTTSTPSADNSNTASKNQLPFSILPISGKTPAALDANIDNLLAVLPEYKNTDIDEIASTLQLGRGEFAYRAAIVTNHVDDAIETLTQKKPPRFVQRKSISRRDVVFMFPGQGSQYVRMGQNLYAHSKIFKNNLDHCAEILVPLLGQDLREILFPPKHNEESAQQILKNTSYTQPALFAIGYSLAQVWQAWGIRPAAMMGHSIGEFAAACVAGVFTLETGLQMIAERGRAMQALPRGSMMSVRLPGDEVQPLLWGEMAIGSYNGPQLCVVSGPDDQVAKLQRQLEAKNVACRHLHTSHAFHSPMMGEIVQPFSEFVSQFQLTTPSIPILSTVTGQWMTDQQATDPTYWANHLRASVRFSDAVTQMWAEDPNRVFVELGPRKTLATLAKQHATDAKNQIAIPTLSDNAENNTEWQCMMTAVAQLWLAGIAIDWNLISSNGQSKEKPVHLSLPTYAFQRKHYFLDPPSQQTRSSATNVPPTLETTTPNKSYSQPANQQLPSPEPPAVSRIPNIVNAIQAVFENTSGFDLDEFDRDTTFFEMGLDSLVLTQTATALKKEMELDVTFRQLLEETTTVDALATWLDNHLPSDKFVTTPTCNSAITTSQTETTTNSTAVQHSTMLEQPVPQPNPAPSAEPQPAPVTLANMTPTTPVASNSTQAIVQSQLQLMHAQLQLLSGQTIMPPLPAESPAVPPLQTTPQRPISEPVKSETSTTKTNSAAPTKSSDLPTREDSPKAFGAAARVRLNDNDLTAEQQAALDEMIRMNNVMMPNSKSYAQRHRKYMADPRTVSGFRPNMKEMTHPIVVDKSKGVYLWDIDGNQYIDFTCGFGSNLLGHGHDVTIEAISQQLQTDYAIGPQSPLAGEVAKLFCELTGSERMAFSNTGSEAVLGCTRLARNATGRDLIVMFNGDYHGILDEVIVRGSKKLKSFPAATGIPKSHVGNTLILDYGTDESLDIIQQNIDEIAAVLVEPVQSRKPELQPREFLTKLRAMTENEPAALIFDEVISGLRIGFGGAQEYFGVQADLASYGKIVGGGMPIGIVAGRASYMDGLDGGYWQYGDDSRPETGMTYYAGTFVRHPLTLAASKAIMEHLKAGGQRMYDELNQLSDYLADEMNNMFADLDAPLFHAHFGSLFKIQFEQELVYSEVFFAGLRRRGIHIWDHRPCLLTLAHEKEHIDQFVAATRDAVIEAQRYGFMPGDGFSKYQNQLESTPPQSGAKLGKDKNGNPGWFVADSLNPGQFIQVGLPTAD